jgi:hypothetical protein
MTHRSLILCMALAVVASGALFTRQELHRRAWRKVARDKPFRLGLVGRPPLDTSPTSDTLPI